MKFSSLLATIATATAAIVPGNGFEGRAAPDAADGLYVVSYDEASGNSTTHFTAWEELTKRAADSTLKIKSAALLETRRDGCGPGSANRNEINDAQDCLKGYFGNTWNFNKNSWTYCIKGSALAFVCPYSNGFKYKTDVESVFTYVDRSCGLSIMGYAQIGGGQGDMTAGRCKSDDHFCTKDFHARD